MSLFLVLLNLDSGQHWVSVLLIPFQLSMGPTTLVITLERTFLFSSFFLPSLFDHSLFCYYGISTHFSSRIWWKRDVWHCPKLAVSDSQSSCHYQPGGPADLESGESSWRWHHWEVHPMHTLCLQAADALSDPCCLELCGPEINYVP